MTQKQNSFGPYIMGINAYYQVPRPLRYNCWKSTKDEGSGVCVCVCVCVEVFING